MKDKAAAAMCIFIFGCLASAGCDDESDVKILRLAHGLDTNHPVHRAMEFMAQKVKEKSHGTMRIDIYPSEQLGSERECIELLQLGCLAMTKTSSSPMEAFVPKIKVLGLPYLFRDDEHFWNVLQGPIGQELLAAGQVKNLKGLCFYDAGARSFYSINKPILSPDDLKGMKIRVQKSDMAMRMIDAMGGSPTPIDWGELYTALQQGVVDGAENNPPSFFTSRHYEICKTYTLDEHARPPDMLLISTFVWKELTDEQKRILSEAVDESVAYQRKIWKEFVEESMAEVQKAGVKIVRPDKKPFRDIVQPLWKEFEGTGIGDLAKRIEEDQ